MYKKILSVLTALAVGILLIPLNYYDVKAKADGQPEEIITAPFADYVGATHTSGRYHFTNEDFLNEGADKLLEIGSRTIKLWLSTKPNESYVFNSSWPTNSGKLNGPHSLLDLISHPYYQEVLKKPFTAYVFEAMEFGPYNSNTGSFDLAPSWKNGFSEEQRINTEKQFYDLTKYLLTNFKNSGKTFVLQNWEGDNALKIWELAPENQPAAIQGMTDWLNARQDGVDRARNEVGMQGVKVVNAAEITRINSSFGVFDHTLSVDAIVPNTHMDLYSFSTWGSRLAGDEISLLEKLSYYKKQAPDSEIYGNVNLMMGEYGAYEFSYNNPVDSPANNYEQFNGPASTKNLFTDEYSGMAQLVANRKQLEYSLQQGAKFLLNWELYCNGLRDGLSLPLGEVATINMLKGVWLIRADGSYTPSYYYYQNLYNPKSISDYLDTWAFTYSHTSNLALTNDNADATVQGDSSRVINTSTNNGSIVYKLSEEIKSFSAKIYFKDYWKDKINFFISQDRNSWTKVEDIKEASAETHVGEWNTAHIIPSSESLPTGNYYLKIEMAPGSGKADLQLSGVELFSSAALSDPNAKYYMPLELNGITVNGTPIQNADSVTLMNYPYTYENPAQPKGIFNSAVIRYVYRYPVGTKNISDLKAVINNPNVDVDIELPEELPGIASIKLTSEDMRTLTYYVHFVEATTGTLKSSSKIQKDESITVTYGLAGVSENVHGISAAEMNFNYDKDVLEFGSATAASYDMKILQTIVDSDLGTIKLLTSYLGEDKVMKTDGDFLNLIFKVKATPSKTTIKASEVVIADRLGTEKLVKPAELEIKSVVPSEGSDNPGGDADEDTSGNIEVPVINGNGKDDTNINVTVPSSASTFDKVNEAAKTSIEMSLINNALEQAKQKGLLEADTISINIPKANGAKEYEVALPAVLFSGKGENDRIIEIKTELGILALPPDMFKENDNVSEAKNVSIVIAKADKSKLSPETKTTIGDQPLYEFKVKVDEEQIIWNNSEAMIEVSIPYIPSAKEKNNPEHIVVWYINDSGIITPVPSGRYNSKTGMVTFKTTHLSKYAISYVEKSFEDLEKYGWAKREIEVLASKGIINGTSIANYTPEKNVKRADFLMLLVKSLSLTAEVDKNFDDVRVEDYYYESVGIAKKLKITEGAGDNLFRPEDNITRQEMMTLTARALNMLSKLTGSDNLAELNSFNDKDHVAPYAAQAIAALIKNDLVKGSNNLIDPLGTATRAEAAVLVYRVYNK